MPRGSRQDKLIRIDLSGKRAEPWAVPAELKNYIGGMGYGTKILVDEVQPQADPLSRDNKLILTVGPLTGTMAPMHPQSCIVTKSPLNPTPYTIDGRRMTPGNPDFSVSSLTINSPSYLLTWYGV